MILKLSHCENPYEVIANYIGNHSEVIEDMIAVLEIDGDRTNELLEYDFDNDSFMFLNDWWEGEQEIALIDYYPVSQACNLKNAVPIEVIERYREKLIHHRDILPQHTMRWMMVDEDICVVDEILKYSKKGEQK